MDSQTDIWLDSQTELDSQIEIQIETIYSKTEKYINVRQRDRESYISLDRD